MDLIWCIILINIYCCYYCYLYSKIMMPVTFPAFYLEFIYLSPQTPCFAYICHQIIDFTFSYIFYWPLCSFLHHLYYFMGEKPDRFNELHCSIRKDLFDQLHLLMSLLLLELGNGMDNSLCERRCLVRCACNLGEELFGLLADDKLLEEVYWARTHPRHPICRIVILKL